MSDGQKPKNNITISKSGDVPVRSIDPTTGRQNRSFAQPNPSVVQPKIEPKAHAGVEDEVEALNENSTKNRNYLQDEDDESNSE